MNKTEIEGLTVYHEVSRLGPGVADNVIAMIKRNAALVSLAHIPPITLSGGAFAKPWDELIKIEGCLGNSGPSDEELRTGSTYECLFLKVPSSASPRPSFHPTKLDVVSAHEMVHLCWPTLRHSPEFDARTVALLRGAKFRRR